MKPAGTCSKFLAFCFAAGLILTSVIVLFLINFERHLFNPRIYKQITRKENIYQELPSILAQQIIHVNRYNPCLDNREMCEGESPDTDQTADEGGLPQYLKNLEAEDWEQFLSSLLKPEWMETETENLIDQLFLYLNNEESALNLKISMVEIKAHLRSEEGRAILLSLLHAQPACTEAQLQSLMDDTASQDFSLDALLLCRPPQDLIEEMNSDIGSHFEEIIEELPDEINPASSLFDEESPNSAASQEDDFRRALGWVRLGIHLSPMLPIICLLMMTLFAVRSLNNFLKWWGIPILISGFCALIIGLLVCPLMDWTLTNLVIDRLPGMLETSLVQLGVRLV